MMERVDVVPIVALSCKCDTQQVGGVDDTSVCVMFEGYDMVV